MKIIQASCVAALTLCLVGTALADDLQTVGDPDATGFSARRLARMTSWFEAQTKNGDPSGFVVAIARGGKLAYLQPTGFADHDRKIPMRPDSIFRIGSMSKQITSVATMILVDDGKLELDAPVAQYLPELRDMQVVKKDPATGDATMIELEPARRAMTIRDLLRNTSGLVYASPDYADPGFGNAAIHALYGIKAPMRRDKTIAPFVASIGTLPLVHQPGEVWEYSLGYDVLGRVIEVVSGQPFDQFLQSRLFAPLHMVDTGFHVPEDKLSRLVALPGAQPAPLTDGDVGKPQTFFSGGGGIVSTVPDFLRFCQMLLNGGELDGARILKPETVRLMTTNSLPPDIHLAGHEAGPAFGTGWGHGFAVRTNPDFSWIPGAVGSYNWQGSWGTFFSVDPAQKLILVMMMQRRQYSLNGFYFNAIRRLPYAALKVPEVSAPTASTQLNPRELTEYAGRYDFGGSASSLDKQTSLLVDGYGWTGLESVVAETDGLRVIKPANGGPAARAGVVAGDLITAIDDRSIKGLALEAAFRRISGPFNAPIKLKIIRQKETDPLVIAFAREAASSHSVELQVRVAGGKLVVEATGTWSILDFDKGHATPVAVRSKDEFQVESGDHTRIAFVRDAAGKVSGAVLNPGPWEQRGAPAQ
ncbi:serine hydrolase [Bradyrhizobium sp. AUGA SZCCT0177]|uniref:serine hydrolase domain-containing protein n=1 Tax=Bradyrhizobium sp. AUGA SZCCT0177 TaxID=2807665 RepID=UPI001BAAA800|nr:serine hydrolase domain-containing protein [Bradyrhizobium sp. AUGA SZCCT0177]MBR1284171.1 serine hydrolase [Bradyrhizobium sp. AUGA SZCCT0177]